MKNKLAATFVLLAALSPLTFVAADAHACGMSVRLDPTPARPSPVMEIARGEKALDAGQNLVAAQAVLGSFPQVRRIVAGADPLQTRALRVFALAVTRSNGEIEENRARGIPGAAQWKPSANLEWAVQSLREIDQKRPNDPSVQADLGEALSKLPHHQAESLAILSRLADKDLMGSPHAYAALARLRTASGDAIGSAAAIKRCEEMSRTPTICRPQAPAAARPTPAAKV